VELFPGFQDDCWFSTGHFAGVVMGFGHDVEASRWSFTKKHDSALVSSRRYVIRHDQVTWWYIPFRLPRKRTMGRLWGRLAIRTEHTFLFFWHSLKEKLQKRASFKFAMSDSPHVASGELLSAST
jgi:hypothetical protein